MENLKEKKCPCDCLNNCGDDPGIDRNEVEPCFQYKRWEIREKINRPIQTTITKVLDSVLTEEAYHEAWKDNLLLIEIQKKIIKEIKKIKYDPH